MRSSWIQGSVLQTFAALARLAYGLLFAVLLLDAFGTREAGTFWAIAVAYQIAFTLCGFGLPYGIVQHQRSDYAFRNPEVRAALAFILLTMVVLFAGVWLFRDRDILGAAIGLHFMVNRLVFVVIFFRRNALEFKQAIYQQLAYDLSIIALLIGVWVTGINFESFAATLLALNAVWLMLLIWTSRIGNQSFAQGFLALRRAFTRWSEFSARTYLTEVIGLILNGLDRLMLAALGQVDFLSIYVLARKFYEVPHNIMTSQSSFVFAILVKQSDQSPTSPKIPKSTSDQSTVEKCGGLRRTRLAVVLIYEGLAILGYGFLAVLFLGVGLIDRVGDLGFLANGLVAIFLAIGVAQASLIPMLNLTYAQGNALFILYYTLANAAIGSGVLLTAWLLDSALLVILSQIVIVLTSWSFMAIYLLREFGLRIGGTIAIGKLILLTALHVWLFQANAFSTLSI